MAIRAGNLKADSVNICHAGSLFAKNENKGNLLHRNLLFSVSQKLNLLLFQSHLHLVQNVLCFPQNANQRKNENLANELKAAECFTAISSPSPNNS